MLRSVDASRTVSALHHRLVISAIEMRADIHALTQDAHDLDGFVGERTVEDDVLPHPMFAIPGSDGTAIATPQGIGGQFVEAKVQLRQIAVALVMAAA